MRAMPSKPVVTLTSPFKFQGLPPYIEIIFLAAGSFDEDCKWQLRTRRGKEGDDAL